MAAKKSDTFEERMKRLEDIVALLESSNIALDQSMDLYREGIGCVKFCREKLEKATHELQILDENEAAPTEDEE